MKIASQMGWQDRSQATNEQQTFSDTELTFSDVENKTIPQEKTVIKAVVESGRNILSILNFILRELKEEKNFHAEHFSLDIHYILKKDWNYLSIVDWEGRYE